jgi:hypothetical protein
MLGVKPAEEVRGYLRLQISHMVGRGFWIKWCSVDKLKRPSPYIEMDILTLQLSPALNDTVESDMGKRAPNVCEGLDDVHVLSIR